MTDTPDMPPDSIRSVLFDSSKTLSPNRPIPVDAKRKTGEAIMFWQYRHVLLSAKISQMHTGLFNSTGMARITPQ
jgi:hypothetical protein